MKRRVAVFVVVCVAALSVSDTSWAALADAPTGLSATAGNVQAALSWTAPASDGGEAISNYTIEHSKDAGTTWVTLIRTTSTVTTHTVTGLLNGSAYLFRVSAVNASGTGPASTTATASPFVVHTAGDAALFSACPSGPVPVSGFTDITSTDVDCLGYYGITKGTTATTYSPDDNVTRWQMALFLTRMAGPAGITLGDGSVQGFTDISGKSAEIRTAINQIKQLGVTIGKTATTYAPDDNVTREEMALFITRLLKKFTAGPGGNTEYITGTSGAKEIKSNDTDHNFTDLPTGDLESRNAIPNLFNLGVTDVQTATAYEPSVYMTRKSMATFVAGALAHTNARPKGLVLQVSGTRVQNGTSVSYSVTHRTDGFAPITGSSVDTFKFNHTTVSTVVRFDTVGMCTADVLTVSSVSNTTKCTVDAADPKTDSSGNLAIFLEVPPSTNKVDVWAWTSTPTTVYDNDIHAAAASKITVETHS
jgi:hypothetical protein